MVRLVLRPRPRSDDDLHVKTPLRTSTRVFPLASSCPGIVHHLSGPNVCAQTPPLPQVERGGSPVRPAREGTGIPNAAALRRPVTFISPRAYSRPIDSRPILDPFGSVFQDGSGVSLPSNPLQGDRIRIEPSSYGPRTHFGQQPRSRGLAAESVPARSLLNATFPHALASGGFGAGLLPVHSPLLRASLSVSFPPLISMLKFSGLSRMICGRHRGADNCNRPTPSPKGVFKGFYPFLWKGGKSTRVSLSMGARCGPGHLRALQTCYALPPVRLNAPSPSKGKNAGQGKDPSVPLVGPEPPAVSE
ncbi:hypothetical protein JTE90_022097 [Oedothorax gibbosus]|uniref:Uncharacterized protein n=1 Tax=Oedothorax gibbosus TaxID=931172 RepID=A0AAV6TER6_9ARAC|nr:hypothetical protein JTE90_022097 [Oedothorax gibbosus]